jgi:hypothetical protein
MARSSRAGDARCAGRVGLSDGNVQRFLFRRPPDQHPAFDRQKKPQTRKGGGLRYPGRGGGRSDGAASRWAR